MCLYLSPAASTQKQKLKCDIVFFLLKKNVSNLGMSVCSLIGAPFVGRENKQKINANNLFIFFNGKVNVFHFEI